MGLSRGKKLALGIATAWPLVFWALYILFFVSLIVTSAGGGSQDSFNRGFVVVFIFFGLTAVDILAVTIVCLYLVIKRFEGTETERLLWLVIVLLGSSLGQAIFYWMKVRPDQLPHVEQALQPDAPDVDA